MDETMRTAVPEKLRRLAWTLAAFTLAGISAAQDLVGETTGGTPPETPATTDTPANAAESGQFMTRFLENYTSWDMFKIGWFVATVVFGYGVATLAYKALLGGNRRATLAGKYGCFWGAVGFIGINLIVFGIVLFNAPPEWLGWVIALVILAIVALLLMSRRKVRA